MHRVVAADYDVIRLDALSRELVEGKVDVIVAGASLAVRAAQRATRAIPIVMAGVGDPVGQGLVASLARPGGNITGIANQADELLSKLIQLLHEVAPQSRRVAILLNESNPQGAALFRAAGERACAALGLMAVWIVPADAAARGVDDGAAIRVFNPRGEPRARAHVTPRIPAGTLWLRDGGPGLNTLTAAVPRLPDAAVDAFAFSAAQATLDARVEVAALAPLSAG